MFVIAAAKYRIIDFGKITANVIENAAVTGFDQVSKDWCWKVSSRSGEYR